MARKGWITIGCSLALAFAVACNKHETHQPANSATPASGPAAAVQTNQYKAVGVVKALNPKEPAIEIDHGDVEGLMPAMQMEFPVTDANLLNGLAVNDRIDFTIENATDGMKVVAIKKL
ncbi:MAG TPA: copper-binding protein [Pyrinomonadaceae bacterium]|jgi:Cu/Ag efflux protein CusF|nr:copper-binding protein [Pyrinomonadaceae bacterium]